MNCGTRLVGAAPATSPPGYVAPWPTAFPGGYPPYPYAPPGRRAKAGDILSSMFEVWTRNLTRFFVVFLLLAVITGVIGAALSVAILGTLTTGTIPGSSTPTLTGVDVGRLVLYIAAAAVASVIVSSVVLGGMTEYAVRRFRGESITVEQAIRRGIQKFLSILGANILVTLIVLALVILPLGIILSVVLASGTGGLSSGSTLAVLCGLLIALLVGGIAAIYVYIALSLYAPAIMIENLGAVNGLGRSWRLTKGHRLSLFGALLVVTLISALVSGLLTVPASSLGNPIASLIATALASAIVGPWAVILVAVAYDLIIREPTYPVMAPPYYGAPPVAPPPSGP